MSHSASNYWHLVEENKRLTNSLKVKDYSNINSVLTPLWLFLSGVWLGLLIANLIICL